MRSATRLIGLKRIWVAAGKAGVEDRPLGCDHRDRAEAAGVAGHVRVGQEGVEQQRAEEAVDADERRPAVRRVQGVRALRRRVRQVDDDVVALHDHGHSQPLRHVAVDAVVVEPPLGAIAAVRDLLDLAAQHPLGVVDERLRVRLDNRPRVLLDQLLEAPDAVLGCGDLAG